MFSTVLSATLNGLCVEFVQVEADVSNGLPMFHMVGYLSSEVKEAGERVRAAIRNSGVMLPPQKVIINLSPANMRKRGTIFDLSIAVAILTAMEELPTTCLEHTLFAGELSLDGGLKKVKGILPIVQEAKKRGCKRCIVPEENQNEGELVEGMEVIGAENLNEVCKILKFGQTEKGSKTQVLLCKQSGEHDADYCEIKGQHAVKRATEIAVAGNHNLLMLGPPGAGKTAIAKRIPSILPPLTREESIELTAIYSIMGELQPEHPLITKRPFREVHHSVTRAALLGGGTIPRPGEITLANKGVLFLDEIAEFPKAMLETLRQPLEERKIRILRERGKYEFPAEFLLVAAMNPCPCGNYPDLNRCTCTTSKIQAYLSKLSQPLLDRIDMCIEVQKVQYGDLEKQGEEETSEAIRDRVIAARMIQKERYAGLRIQTNGQVGMQEVERYCTLQPEEKELMRLAYQRFELTARTYHKVLCVARTIADLAGKESIERSHLREALSYRTIDHKYWRR